MATNNESTNIETTNNEIPLVTIIYKENGMESKYNFPVPTAYSVNKTTMVENGTSVSGNLLSAVIRPNVTQISLSWNYLESSQWAMINKLFEQNYIQKVRFFDETQEVFIEPEMYVSDRSAGMWRCDNNGRALGWTGCSLQLTEV